MVKNNKRTIQLTETHQISRNHRFFNECDRLTFLSKNLWNATNYVVRQYYQKTGKHLSYNKVNKLFTDENQKDYRALPAKVSKGTQRMLEKAYSSFFSKRKKHLAGVKKPGYKHKTNGRQVVHYERGAISTKIKGYVKLSQTNILIKTDKNVDFVKIVPKLDFFVIEIGYTVPLPAPSATTGKGTASIDLGLGNLLTVTSNVMQPIIISGKTVTHINKYSNRLLTQVSTKTVKSSHLTKAIYRKRRNKLKDYFHKTSRFLVDTWVNNNIENVVVGYNKDWKFKNRIQNFSKMAYRTFLDILTYKCQLAGISVIEIEESYSSKASFYDLDPLPKPNSKKIPKFSGKRLKRGIYRTKNNLLVNADINGSLNILRKSKLWHKNMWKDCVAHSLEPVIKYHA